jgi:2-polyprenyl-3-methyl-5-hydroxy-6-metoxy-1,4-benzoquinol methylase
LLKLPQILRSFLFRIRYGFKQEHSGAGQKRWEKPYEVLRSKWVEVPAGSEERRRSDELLRLNDEELVALWSKAREGMTTGTSFEMRGWYQLLYADVLRGRKVLDVGCGMGFDSITYAQQGAKMTFVDIVDTNVEIVHRLCRILGLRDVNFLYMENVESLSSLDTDFDAILCMGSLHHMPYKAVREEVQELIRHLKIGGRWIQLAYPRSRWLREGRMPFKIWGAYTDGAGTSWAEWYDLPKLLNLLEPARFDVILYREFYNNDFNWFDLIRRE